MIGMGHTGLLAQASWQEPSPVRNSAATLAGCLCYPAGVGTPSSPPGPLELPSLSAFSRGVSELFDSA